VGPLKGGAKGRQMIHLEAFEENMWRREKEEDILEASRMNDHMSGSIIHLETSRNDTSYALAEKHLVACLRFHHFDLSSRL